MDRPTGKLTFLFSDVEGSTRLLMALGDGYAQAHREHQQIVRDGIGAHAGMEVSTEGDSFFVVFARASDARSSASEVQAALADGLVSVRVGVHTGEPLLVDGNYVGLDVHKAARISGVAHGGQVLVSQATRDLAGLELVELG